MSEVKIKHRTFEILEEVDENTFIATFKNKKYDITKFEPKTEVGDELAYFVHRISKCGVRVPKLFFIDKKLGYIVKEHLEGETVMSYFAREDLPENIYSQLFENAYLAKMNRITLNYEIDKWSISNGTLYYTYPYFIVYNEEKDLVKHYIRLWFKTKELQDFLKKNSLDIDKKRLKGEYETNKEIVLTTLKYYK